MARALINHPLLILADEPTGNLDSKSSRAVIRSFEQAKESLEATIFMVTHDSFAASFCDRVVILRDGVVWRTLEKGRHGPHRLPGPAVGRHPGHGEGVRPCGTFPTPTRPCAAKTGASTPCWQGCGFFSVLLITAYVCMMRSPPSSPVLPEGGDSRKQVMMVFVLAVIGCAVFTAYAAGLFFRQKSGETGVFLALGATRRQLQREMGKELAVISLGSCAAGAALGGPLAWGVWQLFRLFLVDSQEMALSFDPRSYLLSMVFAAYVVGMLFFLGGRSIRRTNIIDIVQESHKSEPIREVKRWYGSVGIVLVVIGALAGFLMPSFFITVLHWYSPLWGGRRLYLPALVGMYMILLHTVVNGWRKRHKYRDIIATSMMKFQGRQTVRNMLVMIAADRRRLFRLLLRPHAEYQFHLQLLHPAGGLRSTTGGMIRTGRSGARWNLWRRSMVLTSPPGPRQTPPPWAVTALSPSSRAGALGTTYTQEYQGGPRRGPPIFPRAPGTPSPAKLDLAPGTCANVLDDEGGSDYLSGGDVTLVTNMVTGPVCPLPRRSLCVSPCSLGRYVLDDADYEILTAGLTDLWRETWVFFNVADSEASYPFADALFNEIVDRSGDDVLQMDAYDLVSAALAEEAGEVYDYDRAHIAAHGFPVIEREDRDTSEFRNYWLYMPQFRVLDQNDFVTTMAVFLVLFIFIALICFAAVIVIAFTRCMTIALTNARVYDDLRHLGAPNRYLFRSVKGRCPRCFLCPSSWARQSSPPSTS